MSDSNKALMGLLLGAAAGVAIGLLIAPESGERKRKKLKKVSRDLARTLGDKAEDAVEVGNGRVSELKAKLRQFV
jgi:gas vesicle protein